MTSASDRPGLSPAEPPSPESDAVPPGPRGVPWLGCSGALLADPTGFFRRVAVRFGGIARIPLKSGRQIFLVSAPRQLKQLLLDQRERYVKNIRYPAMQRVLGEGLLLSEGDRWRRQRLLTQPAFKPAELSRQLQWMAPIVAGFLERWEAPAREGHILDVELEFLELTQLLAGRLIFGEAFAPRARAVFETTEAIKAHWPKPPRNLLLALLPRKQGLSEALEGAIRDLEHEFFALIDGQLGGDRGGILGMLIEASAKQDRPFTRQELRDQAMTLFFAGYETSAASMAWTHYLLWQHPDARERLWREVDDLVGDRLPTPEDIARLAHVERVLDESLRLYSPIHSLSRVATEDNAIGGYTVPKGCTAVVSLYATHRLPDEWPEPDRFDPDRFLPEACAARSSYAYIPFAIGHRNCIGGTLAVLEGKLILAQVAQRFRLDLAPGAKVVPYAATTLRPRFGMPMRIAPRKRAVTPADA
ncbi:MAG TPA: cytochrome P450 [Pelomicrobium sp.]|nr:cytochrome P450 [Pelomicrobium sp.]